LLIRQQHRLALPDFVEIWYASALWIAKRATSSGNAALIVTFSSYY